MSEEPNKIVKSAWIVRRETLVLIPYSATALHFDLMQGFVWV